MHQRAGLNLSSSKPSGKSCSRYCISGFRVAELVLVRLLAVLFVDGFSLVHTVIYDAHKQAHNQEKNKGFIVELESETIKLWRQG